MTPLRLLPAVPAMTVAEERANSSALMGVAVGVRRELRWNLRLRGVLGEEWAKDVRHYPPHLMDIERI